MLILLSSFRLLSTSEYPGVSQPPLCSRGEHGVVGLCSDDASVEFTAEHVVCGAADPARFPALTVITVALERGLPCEVAVGTSQQAVGDPGNDVALGEVAVFGMDGGAVRPVKLCVRRGICPAQWGHLLVVLWLDRVHRLVCPSSRERCGISHQ